MSYLWNSMQLDISGTCRFLTIQKAIKQSYSQLQDAAQIYEIKKEKKKELDNSSTKQGILSVIEYYNILNSLWLDLIYYQNFQMKCSEDVTMLQKLD